MSDFASWVQRAAGHDATYERPEVRDDSPLLRKIAAEAKARAHLATDPHNVTVGTIMQMVHAFPGMAPDAASRLLHEADQAAREGEAAADTLGVFLAEARHPTTGALEAGVRYRVHKIANRHYEVRVEAVDEQRKMISDGR